MGAEITGSASDLHARSIISILREIAANKDGFGRHLDKV
jgi:hypothetical protein